jgi:hypothetical protein
MMVPERRDALCVARRLDACKRTFEKESERPHGMPLKRERAPV